MSGMHRCFPFAGGVLPILLTVLFLASVNVAWSQTEIYTNRLAIGNAVESDDAAALAQIAAHGGNLEEKNLFGLTPLMEAARAGSPKCAAVLISHGVDLNALSMDGFPAVYFAVYIDPADPEQQNPAYLKRRADVLKELIDAGAKFTQVLWKTKGFGLVHIAALSGNLPCLKVLSGAGADLNAKGAFGVTPLMVAATQGDPSVVRYLVEAGADPAAETVGGRNAFDYAADWPQVIAYLKGIGSGPGSYRRMLDQAFGAGS